MRGLLLGLGCYFWFCLGFSAGKSSPLEEKREKRIARYIVTILLCVLALACTLVSCST